MLWMLKIYMGSRRHCLDSWKENQSVVMPVRAWKVLELQVIGNKENTLQPSIVMLPWSDLPLAVERNTVRANPKLTWNESLGGSGD